MKKYILLVSIAIASLAATAQTTEGDYLVTSKEDSITQVEAAEQAYKDSVQTALDYQYATQKITLMADKVVLLEDLKYRPVLVVDSANNFYATLGQYAVMFERLQGRMWNKQREEVRLNLIKGKAPEINFRNVKTDVAVDPSTLR